jgi:tRNA1(Val) A37 N6-methylase TrmN6
VEVTVDAFLGGKVEAVQPAAGHHRSGLEAVLLATTLDRDATGQLVDLGAGAGVAGFCVAARCEDIGVTLIERDPVLVACANAALGRKANGAFSRRVTPIETDIFRERTSIANCDEVLMNPPFHREGTRSPSPERARAGAHVLAAEGLEGWVKAATAMLRPRARMTLIFSAEGLGEVLSAIGNRFGGLDLLPIHPRAPLPAHRVIVSGRKGSRAPLRVLPPLVLHGVKGNAFLPEVDSLLRGATELDEVLPSWRNRR